MGAALQCYVGMVPARSIYWDRIAHVVAVLNTKRMLSVDVKMFVEQTFSFSFT